MQIGDFNGDGHQDLVTMNSNSFNFSIFLGNGSGGFTASTGQSVANQSGPNFVVVGDFNEDGNAAER
jgi:trimeric autotransporter adhesin